MPNLRRLLCLLLWASAARADLAADVDSLFQDFDKPGVPGAAVLVVRSGMVSYRKGYGLEDLEAGLSASAETNYRMASVTKQFTAMAALMLVDRGSLKLDEALTEIFSDFPAYGKTITVSHLLHHTSGLKDYEDLIPSGQTKQIDDTDVLALLKKQSSGDFAPGSRYRYSNGGYCLLAQIVEKRSGKSFGRFLEENVFRALGMSESRVYDKNNPPAISRRAYGYSKVGGAYVRTDQSVTSATQGDGGVYTSAVDMERWLKGLDSLIPSKLLAQMFTAGKLNDGTAHSYGMGWVIDTYRGLKRHSHTGSTIGFRTAVQKFPERDFAVAVFINREGSTPWDTARAIVDKVLFAR